jgi:hypothetical protein
MCRYVLSLLCQILLLSSWGGGLAARAATADALTPSGSTQMPFTVVSGSFAVWTGGAFLFVQDRFSGAPIFRTIDRNGIEVSQFTFTIPGASLINIYSDSVARGLDGSLAIVGTAYTGESRGGAFVAWVSPDRQEQTVIRVSPFFPHTVTLASDGTIWVAGDEFKKNRKDIDYSQHLVRRYDKNGKLLGSFVPWSSLGTDAPRYFPTPSIRSVLLSLKDRIGWYSPGSNTYIEFSLEGSVVSRFKTAPHQTDDVINVVLCDNGGLFASTQIPRGEDKTNFGIFSLDRQRSEWSLVPRNEQWGMLYGCDGTRLASTTDFRTVSWLEPTVN